jgi:hypothetical protein
VCARSFEGQRRFESRLPAHLIEGLTQAVAGCQRDEVFTGGLTQLDRSPFGQAVIGCHSEVKRFVVQHNRFQLIVLGWQRRDDDHVEQAAAHLVDQVGGRSLSKSERHLRVGREEGIEERRHVAQSAAV